MKLIEKSSASATSWDALAEQVLAGSPINRIDALSILDAPDTQLLPILAAAYQVRNRYFGNTVQLYYLMNVKSGLCPEDCHYCSQSKVSNAPIPKYAMLSTSELVAGAKRAAEAQACTFCIVASGRGPTERELDQVSNAVKEIKETTNLRVCACLGILKPGQAAKLKDAGVDRYNHNLNSSQDFHANIVTTHTYDDRVRTISGISDAGISPCSGGIIGLGESPTDVVDMAFALRDLNVESIPLNFFIPIPGTPFQDLRHLTPQYCLKALAMFRMVNPDRELRIAGGREVHLRSLQPLGLYAANSIFVSDYLTTPGQSAEADYQMIADMGFTVVGQSTPPTE